MLNTRRLQFPQFYGNYCILKYISLMLISMVEGKDFKSFLPLFIFMKLKSKQNFNFLNKETIIIELFTV